MARFPKVPGAGAKSINNPVYWSRMALQNQRYREKSAKAAERFNSRWLRLCRYYDFLNDHYLLFTEESNDSNKPKVRVPDEKKTTMNRLYKELAKLAEAHEKMVGVYSEINQNIESAKTGDLNKFATSIKNMTIKLAAFSSLYCLYDNITDAHYNKEAKTLTIDDIGVWDLN